MAEDMPRWRTAWIVGASSGIGAALARLMADEKEAGTIGVSARSADALSALAETHPALVSVPLDVTDGAAVTAATQALDTPQAPLDLVVICAGAWKQMNVETLDLAAIRRGIEVNYLGAMNVLHAVLPAMMARRRGHIALMGSVAGYRGLPNALAYGPTKAALINLAEILRADLRPYGIVVSIINPGFVKTPMTDVNTFPMPQLISAEEAAKSLLAGLRKRRFLIAFPVPFVWVMRALSLLPYWLFFRLTRRLATTGQGLR